MGPGRLRIQRQSGAGVGQGSFHLVHLVVDHPPLHEELDLISHQLPGFGEGPGCLLISALILVEHAQPELNLRLVRGQGAGGLVFRQGASQVALLAELRCLPQVLVKPLLLRAGREEVWYATPAATRRAATTPPMVNQRRMVRRRCSATTLSRYHHQRDSSGLTS